MYVISMPKYTKEEYREVLRKNKTKHGMFGTRFYRIFRKMIERCNNKNSYAYSRYGGRGIVVTWKDFQEFKNDMYLGYLEHIKQTSEKQTTIDRIDNDGNYSKQNCRWATYKEQANNKNYIFKRTNYICFQCGKECQRIPSWCKTEKLFCNKKCFSKSIEGRHSGGSGNGEQNAFHKLTERQVIEILKSKEKGITLAKKFKVTNSTISSIRKRKIWKHIIRKSK